MRPESARFLAAGDRGKATVLISSENSLDASFFSDTQKGHTSDAGGSATESICVFRPEAYGYGHQNDVPGDCFGLPQLLAGRGYTETVDAPHGRGIAFGLVPDGVASVTAEFTNAPDVTAPVSDNYFEISMRGAELGTGKGDFKGGIQRVAWHDAAGALVPQGPDAEGKSGEALSKTEGITYP